MRYNHPMRKFFRNLVSKRKDRFDYDDGIDFQWGDNYIRAYEIIEGVGGKYWRNNGGGTITEYSVPELRIKSAIRGFYNSEYKVKRIAFDKVRFSKVEDAVTAVSEINESYFWAPRNTRAIAHGPVVTVITTNEVFESTYEPGGSL